MKILLATLLVASLGLNVYLWNASSTQRRELAALQASANELDELRRQNQELQTTRASSAGAASDSDAKELARLRNEVSQLRKTAAEVPGLRAEVAQLRTQLADASQSLAQKEKDLSAAAATAEQSEQAQQARQRGLSLACMNNLKQIGLAARVWANDHGNVFPPDFTTMRNELGVPKILFCPASPTGVQATDWTQLNAAAISYQFLNPNGSEADPQKPLTACPIHGHVGMSDGSVRAGGK